MSRQTLCYKQIQVMVACKTIKMPVTSALCVNDTLVCGAELATLPPGPSYPSQRLTLKPKVHTLFHNKLQF